MGDEKCTSGLVLKNLLNCFIYLFKTLHIVQSSAGRKVSSYLMLKKIKLLLLLIREVATHSEAISLNDGTPLSAEASLIEAPRLSETASLSEAVSLSEVDSLSGLYWYWVHLVR